MRIVVDVSPLSHPRTGIGNYIRGSLAGMAEAFRDWLSTWEEWRVEAEEYRELDGERMLVLFHFSARGKTSGLEIEQIWTKGASLFHLRGGQVTRLVQYLDRAKALEAVGLRE